MEFLGVKNFTKFQHYKDRNPPWIKLYYELLDDYQFACLQDDSKMHLIGIWLLASRSDNRVPNDPKWIASRISATSPVNIAALVSAGFLEVYDADSNLIAEREQGAMLETETETETETDKRESRKPSPKKMGRLPSDWTPTLEHIAYCAANHIDLEHELESFKLNAEAKAGTSANWDASFSTWIRKEWVRKLPTANGKKPTDAQAYTATTTFEGFNG